MNKICVVIPMYGHEDITDKCVNLTIMNAGCPIDILVVDDGSPKKYVRDDVHVLSLDKNSGFTNALNQGILWCSDRYEFIHVLNNDTEPEKDFIKILYEFMLANPVVGIAASARRMITNSPHNIELYGADLIRGHQILSDGNVPNKIFYVNWLPICSALIRHSMIREIGLLDKYMRTWCSDNDYCIRANFAGWNVALVMESKVLHIHQVTTGNTLTEEASKAVMADQKVLIEKMAGIKYAELMRKLPLDCEGKSWGKLTFEVYTK